MPLYSTSSKNQLNKKSGLSLLLDRLGAVGDTVGNILTDVNTGKGVSGSTFDPINPFTDGNYRASARSVGKSMGIESNAAASTAGFLVKTFGDPTAYTGFGTVNKFGKAAKMADAVIDGGKNFGKIGEAFATARKGVGSVIGQGRVKEIGSPFFKQTLGAQSKYGQRDLMTFAGRSVFPRSVDDTVFNGMTRLKQGMTGEKSLTGFADFDEGVAKFSKVMRGAFTPKLRKRPLTMSEEDFLHYQKVGVKLQDELKAADYFSAQKKSIMVSQIRSIATQISKTDTRKKVDIIKELTDELSNALQQKAFNSMKEVKEPANYVRAELRAMFDDAANTITETTKIRKAAKKTVVDGFYLPLVLIDGLSGKYKAKTSPKIGKTKFFSGKDERDIASGWRIADMPGGKAAINTDHGGSFMTSDPGKMLQLTQKEIADLEKTYPLRRAVPREINEAMGKEFFAEDPSIMVAIALQGAGKAEAMGRAIMQLKKSGWKDVNEAILGIPKELGSIKEMADQIPDGLTRDEEMNQFLKLFGEGFDDPKFLSEENQGLIATFETYNTSDSTNLIPRVDMERMVEMQEELGMKIVPIDIPTTDVLTTRGQEVLDATFSSPGNKAQTMNNIIKDQIKDSIINGGKEVVVDHFSGAGTMVATMPDLAKSGAKEFHLNFFDDEKFIIQNALYNGQIKDVQASASDAYNGFMNIIESSIGKSKNKQVRDIFREFKSEVPAGRFGTQEFNNWYFQKGYPPIRSGGTFHTAWKSSINTALKNSNPNSIPPQNLDDAMRIAVFDKIASPSGTQQFLGKSDFIDKNSTFKKFQKLLERDSKAYASTQSLGAEVVIHNSEGKKLIQNISKDLRERGLINKTVAYSDPPYVRDSTMFAKKNKGILPDLAVKNAAEYSTPEGLRNIYRPIMQDIENGMDFVATNDVNPDYIEEMIGGTTKMDPFVYTYKEGNTPTSLISTRNVKNFQSRYAQRKPGKGVKRYAPTQFIRGNVDVKSGRSKSQLRDAIREKISAAGFTGDERDFLDAAKGRVKISPVQKKQMISKRLKPEEKAVLDSTSKEDFREKARDLIKKDLARENNRKAELVLDNYDSFRERNPDMEDWENITMGREGEIILKPRKRLRAHKSEQFRELTRKEGRELAEEWTNAANLKQAVKDKEFEFERLRTAFLSGKKRMNKNEKILFDGQTIDIQKQLQSLRMQLGRAKKITNLKAIKNNPKFKSFMEYVETEREFVKKYYKENLKGMRGDSGIIDERTNLDLYKEMVKSDPKFLGPAENYEQRLESLEYFEDEFTDYIQGVIDIERTPISRNRKKITDTKSFFQQKSDLPVDYYDAEKQVLTLDEMVDKKFGDRGFSGTPENFYDIVKDIRQQKPAPRNYLETNMPELEGYKFAPPEAEFINQVTEAFTNIEEVNEIFKAYDTMQSFWKKTATLSNLAYHTRNGVSASFMNWYGGMKGVDAAVAYQESGEVIYKLAAGEILTAAQQAQWDEFTSRALNAQLFEGVQDSAKKLTQSTQSSLLSKTIGNENPLFKAGEKAGHTTEDFFRFALFRYERSKGFSVSQASETVKKIHYDYGDLSTFESQVLRRVFPFYSWTRKNLPRSVEILIQNPEKLARIGKMQDAFSGMFEDEPLDPDLLPEYLQKGIPMFLGKNKDGDPVYFRLKGVIPALDLDSAMNPLETGAGMISPFLKTPVEIGTNYDLFRGRTIKDYDGQKVSRFGGNMQLDPNVNKVLSNIRPINELEKITTGSDSEYRGGQKAISAVLGSVTTANKGKSITRKFYDEKRELSSMNRDRDKLKANKKSTRAMDRKIQIKEKIVKKLNKQLPK